MNTHYRVRTENKRTHGKGQYALRNTDYSIRVHEKLVVCEVCEPRSYIYL